MLATINDNPQISSRQIERESGIIKGAYYKFLLNINTIHIVLTFIKIYTDFENRVTFCQWVQHEMHINNEFLSLILFTDETSFTNYGLANLHNMHYWSVENPHWLREVDRQRQSVGKYMVWYHRRQINQIIFYQWNT